MSRFIYRPSPYILGLPVPRQYDYRDAQAWDFYFKEFEWRKRTGDPLLSRPIWMQTNVRTER